MSDMTRKEAIVILKYLFNLSLRLVPIFLDSTDREAL